MFCYIAPYWNDYDCKFYMSINMQVDLLAEVYFKKTREGGRATNIKGTLSDSSYGCSLFIANEGFECRLMIGNQLYELGKHYWIQIKFMRSNSAIGKFSINTSFRLWEGKIIATGRVIKILRWNINACK